MADTEKGMVRYTVLGLFEDMIDAEHALLALRRADRPAEQVSVLVRDRAADQGYGSGGHSEVARAVVASALDTVSGWLLGLAALIVPEQGPLLVAGPIGAALGRLRSVSDSADEPAPAATADSRPNDLQRTLTEFGFAADEAHYIASRVGVGSIVIAVTTSDWDQLSPTRRLFAEYNAVHIGQAQTGEVVAQEAAELLSRPPEDAIERTVVVADVVATFSRLCQAEELTPVAAAVCGATVLDSDGVEAGEIEDLLATSGPDGSQILCYVVIGYGGLLGLGRHLVAVPAELVDLSAQPPRLSVTRDLLRRTIAFDPDVPFSRQEESAVHAFFGTKPYWLK